MINAYGSHAEAFIYAQGTGIYCLLSFSGLMSIVIAKAPDT